MLTQAEVEWILQLGEEEKLARDLYLTLGKCWQVPIFSNIARSEQRHMDAVKTLIVKYGLTDPVVDDTVGAFTNEEFSNLYEDLVAAGSVSVIEAYGVGVYIEELDIEDLTAALAVVSNRDILAVFKNLLAGSQNHLTAFLSHL